jgi:Tfp pilus assembly protein PilO
MTRRRLRFDLRQAGGHLRAVLVLWTVANIALYVLLVRPAVREYRNLLEGTGPQQQELRAQRAEVERRETYLNALVQAEQDLTRLRDEVLSTRERRMVEVQLELKSLADQFGIDLDSVTFESELMRNEELDKLRMVVPLEGGYTNLRRFLQAVESSSKFLVVEGVALGEGKHGGAMLQLNISLATYFDVPPELKRVNQPERRGRRPSAPQPPPPENPQSEG